MKNKDGVIVGDEKGVLEVWAEYFKKLLDSVGKELKPEGEDCFGPEQDIRVPSIEQVSAVIRKFKVGRAPGEEAIKTDLVESGGRMSWRKVHVTIDRGWKGEQMA